MERLDGANCADLPGFVVDKYFYATGSQRAFRMRVALEICRKCAVLEACRSQAFAAADLQSHGVIGGVTAAELRRARKWRSYEQGLTESPPRGARPTWLPMTDATEAIERLRLEDDPDERL